jgi:hypothetical protein
MYCCCVIGALNSDSPKFPDSGPCLQPFLAVDIGKLMKSASTWYSTGSSWPDLPNGCKISGWLHQFHGKLVVHSGVGVTQLTISKFLRNPPRSCGARHPPAFEHTWIVIMFRMIILSDRMVNFEVTWVNLKRMKIHVQIFFIEQNKTGKCGTPGRGVCQTLTTIWC